MAASWGQTPLLPRAVTSQERQVVSVVVMDCLAWEFLAEVAVKCTESHCHPHRGSGQRGHLRDPAHFFPQTWCHLLLASTAHGGGPLLLLTSLFYQRLPKLFSQLAIQTRAPMLSDSSLSLRLNPCSHSPSSRHNITLWTTPFPETGPSSSHAARTEKQLWGASKRRFLFKKSISIVNSERTLN